MLGISESDPKRTSDPIPSQCSLPDSDWEANRVGNSMWLSRAGGNAVRLKGISNKTIVGCPTCSPPASNRANRFGQLGIGIPGGHSSRLPLRSPFAFRASPILL